MSNAIVFLPLTQGKVAVIDFSDFEKVRGIKWCVKTYRGLLYAVRGIRKPNGKKTTLSLHQFLLPDAEEVDHIDGDGLNNRRGNLRAVTHQQNLQGFQRKRAGTSSQFRGVCWCKAVGKWQSQIMHNKKNSVLGWFEKEEDAARAYDAAARQCFGKVAAPNFP